MPFLFRGSRILIWPSCPPSISKCLPSVQKKCPLPHFYVLSNFHGNLPPKFSYSCLLLGIQVFFNILKFIYFNWRLILYNIVLVLPYINMNPPWVWNSGFSQRTLTGDRRWLQLVAHCHPQTLLYYHPFYFLHSFELFPFNKIYLCFYYSYPNSPASLTTTKS